MASRSLGVLTLDLVTRLGGFVEGLSKADREADKRAKSIARKGKEIEKAWGDATKLIAAGFAGITVASVFQKFIAESRDAQNEQAQLAAAIKSTGGAAGYTQEQLNKMAEALQNTSTFSSGDVNKAQARLLSYTNVVGKQFPEALQAAIDMATRMGISVEQAAENVGRALDIPSQGLASLSRQGFRFTEDQKKVLEQMENTGRTAEAQEVILKALQTAYGGAAQAARGTLGGAMAAIQSQLKGLMTGSDGSLNGAAEAVNGFAEVLASQKTRNAFGVLTSLLAGTIEMLVKATSAFITFGQMAGEVLGRLTGVSADPIDQLDQKLINLRKDSEDLRKELETPRNFDAGNGYSSIDELRERLKQTNAEVAQLEKSRKFLADLATGGNRPNNAPSSVLPTPGAIRSGSGDKKDPLAEAKKYLENLEKQRDTIGDLTTEQKALIEIESGRIAKITPALREQILLTAQQIDLKKEQEALEKRIKDAQEGAAKAMIDESFRALEAEAKAINDVVEAREKLLQSMIDASPSAQLERDREAMLLLAEAFNEGRITADQFNEAATTKLGLFGEKIKETKTFAEEFGMTFTSALEDAIVAGGKLSDVLKAVGQDILRLMVRQSITEPLFKSISSGSIFGDIGKFFGSLFSFDGGGYTGDAPRTGGIDGMGGRLAVLHPQETVIDHYRGQGGGQNIVVNAAPGASRNDVIAATQYAIATSVGMVIDSRRRRGFA